MHSSSTEIPFSAMNTGASPDQSEFPANPVSQSSPSGDYWQTRFRLPESPDLETAAVPPPVDSSTEIPVESSSSNLPPPWNWEAAPPHQTRRTQTSPFAVGILAFGATTKAVELLFGFERGVVTLSVGLCGGALAFFAMSSFLASRGSVGRDDS